MHLVDPNLNHQGISLNGERFFGVGDRIGTGVDCAASLILSRAALALNVLLTGMPPLISRYMLYDVRLNFIVGRVGLFFWRYLSSLPCFSIV